MFVRRNADCQYLLCVISKYFIKVLFCFSWKHAWSCQFWKPTHDFMQSTFLWQTALFFFFLLEPETQIILLNTSINCVTIWRDIISLKKMLPLEKEVMVLFTKQETDTQTKLLQSRSTIILIFCAYIQSICFRKSSLKWKAKEFQAQLWGKFLCWDLWNIQMLLSKIPYIFLQNTTKIISSLKQIKRCNSKYWSLVFSLWVCWKRFEQIYERREWWLALRTHQGYYYSLLK